MLIDQDSLQTTRVIRPIDHGDFVQLLCSDERGLLSVYFEIAQFEVFINYLYKANMELGGLLITTGFSFSRFSLLSERYLQGKVWFTSSQEDGTRFYALYPLSIQSHPLGSGK